LNIFRSSWMWLCKRASNSSLFPRVLGRPTWGCGGEALWLAGRRQVPEPLVDWASPSRRLCLAEPFNLASNYGKAALQDQF